MNKLEDWVLDILADPITKEACIPDNFKVKSGVLDARVFLKNTYGYDDWFDGQTEYEEYASSMETTVQEYLNGIEGARPIYEHYKLEGHILDCGGGAGTLREHLSKDVKFISTDPFIEAVTNSSSNRKEAHSCLSQNLNFIAATAEFQPFIGESFDWVHMRSMLDHVQVVDLTLMEAHRVLKPEGRILLGLYVEGGKNGKISFERKLKDFIKHCLEAIGINRWKDYHIWHPTYENLIKVITDNGFEIEDVYWQPQFVDKVCYVCATKHTQIL